MTITEFPIEPGAAAGAHVPYAIVAGPDGGLWYTDAGTKHGIGRIDTAGERIAPIVTPYQPFDLVTAPDGTVSWTDVRNVGSRSPAGVVTEKQQLTARVGVGDRYRR